MAIYDFLLWYGIIALTHLFNQINLAHAEYLKSTKENHDSGFAPRVLVVIPAYNEIYNDLEKCIRSVLTQNYEGSIKVEIVDDGSRNKDIYFQLIKTFDKEIKSSNLIVNIFEKNRGKREAQKFIFDKSSEEFDIIVTIDSDTILDKQAIKYLVQKFKDKQVGAVSGNVGVNNSKGLLAKLISKRYWTAFNQERAAQSLFGTVLCCSGPLAAYRSDIIKRIKEKYVSQEFLGLKCTFGDDRHLTNLVLAEGYKVKYERRAIAKTNVPTTLKGWLKQQIRWNKSFYRELIWTMKILVKKPLRFHPYIIYDVAVQTILPILLFFSLIYMAYNTITVSLIYLLGYISVLVGIALLRASYAFIRTKDKLFFLFPLYAFLHVFLLIPVRMISLARLKSTGWGTR